MAAAPAAAKKATATPARKRQSKPKNAEAVNAPKLSKAQKETVEQAVRLGLDVDPLNFDIGALRAAVKIADEADAITEETPVGIQGTDGVVFERGMFRGRKGDVVRMKNDLGSVEIPLSMVGKFVAINEQQVGAGGGPIKDAVRKSASEPRAPREGSGLWAALEVLKAARKPMTGADVFAKIKERRLAPGLKGKTPEATITAALNVAAARGQHGITRPEPGKFQLQKGGK